MYKAFYLERSDGDGDLCAVVNITDIEEDLSEVLTSQIEYILRLSGEGFFTIDGDSSDFPDVWEKSEMNKKDWIEKNLSNLENQESEEFAELVEEYEILFNGADLMEDLELYYA